MNIRGESRAVLSRNGTVIVDTGWKSDEIVEVYGIFLGALMKKAFYGVAGTEDRSTELTRTILLTFPIEEKEVVS